MANDERALAEAAFADLSSPRGTKEPQWPPVARRIREARERRELSKSEVAAKIGLTLSEYQDVEFHDDEVFMTFSVKHLRVLGEALGLPLPEMLFGPGAEPAGSSVSFPEIARRLAALAASRKVDLDELSDSVGWEVAPIVQDPAALGELNLDGLRDVCAAVGVDWVSALVEKGDA